VSIGLYYESPLVSFATSDVLLPCSGDQWTEDGILEFYWGDHIHLASQRLTPRCKGFLTAKSDFVHEMVQWVV
jgi:MPBQ/MSBQ methyltransferase